MLSKTSYIGKPVSRTDGRAKVKGEAQYAGEFQAEDLAYGVVVSSAIAKGRIRKFDLSEASAVTGVLKIFTHENVSGLAWFNVSYTDMDAPAGKHFRFLQTDRITYSMQPVALVVADTFEQARYAASLVKVDYEQESPETSLLDHLDKARKPRGKKTGFKPPKSRGNFSKAYKGSDVRIEAEYYHGAEHHNPMEMHASTVVYKDGGKLDVYDKTQGVFNSLKYITGVFNLSYKDVEVYSPFVGGAFGSGLRPQYQLFMAVLAALDLKRPVRVSLTRQQMFSFGHRPVTLQKLALGASADGTLQAISHSAISETSQFEDYVEIVVNWSGMLYQCENVRQEYKLVSLDTYTPLDMRAPGAATGVHAIECAMDELSYALRMDPLKLRMKNYAATEQMQKKPFSSKALYDCYIRASESFGWEKRIMQPRSMRDGDLLVGWGMATGIWDAQFIPSRARAEFTADGKLTVGSGTADIGTGTYTIMTQIAAETLGLPLDDVTFRLGDTSLPLAFIEGGSATAASVGTAVQNVCLQVKEKLFKLAKKAKGSPFRHVSPDEVTFSEGHIRLLSNPTVSLSLTGIMNDSKTAIIRKTSTAMPNLFKQMSYAQNTHSAVFAEVKVDEELGVIKVSRVVSAIAAGRILNPKTARSQIIGGIVWGISMALYEDSAMDHNLGRFINHNYAEYHVPVNLDINDLEVIFVEEEDQIVNPLGVKGVGEIGLVGVSAAVANAVFHATGKRVRKLPITLDHLL